jgi:8-oxo-dGTP pyrophosphatase MutT (NUDIX family)
VFYFLTTFAPGACPVPDGGWSAAGEPFRLWRTLDAAEAATRVPGVAPGAGRVLVLDAAALSVADGPDGPTTAAVPRAAVCNVDPDGDLAPPVTVVAAGGLVERDAPDGREVLMIFRRGCWDLPKGKLDDGETVEACALREVSEEVGVAPDRLAITAPLGTTVHGYPLPRRHAYAVKTTHWYAMATTAEAFEAQDDEGIEAVTWVPLADAAARVGYASLRDLLADRAAG